MENRHEIRHDGDLLHESLSRVTLTLPDKLELAASVVDISSHGMKVSIPTSGVFLSIPGKNESVEVHFQAIGLQVSCRCIYVLCETKDNMFMGLYVFEPDQQDRLHELIEELE
jgi:hypothetical protein